MIYYSSLLLYLPGRTNIGYTVRSKVWLKSSTYQAIPHFPIARKSSKLAGSQPKVYR